MWHGTNVKVRGQLAESHFSFLPVGPRDGIQVTSLGGTCLLWLSHLAAILATFHIDLASLKQDVSKHVTLSLVFRFLAIYDYCVCIFY